MRLPTVITLLLVASLGFRICYANHAPAYTAVLISSSGRPLATAINNQCVIAGQQDNKASLWNGIDGSVAEVGSLPPTAWAPINYTTADEVDNSTVANALNDHGTIVGSHGGYSGIVMSGTVDCYAIIGDAHGVRPLTPSRNPPGQDYSGDSASDESLGINNQGVIVGNDAYRGFYRAGKKQVVVKPLSHAELGNGTTCCAVNAAGWFIGATTIDKTAPARISLKTGQPISRGKFYNRLLHAFLCRGAYPLHQLIDLGALPNKPFSTATALNGRGEVVGYASAYGSGLQSEVGEGDANPFLWRRGVMRALPLPAGATSAIPCGINDVGEIVGETIPPVRQNAFAGGFDRQIDPRYMAVLWSRNAAYDLNDLTTGLNGGLLTAAVGINSSGYIVCNGITLADSDAVWLLVPTGRPLPTKR